MDVSNLILDPTNPTSTAQSMVDLHLPLDRNILHTAVMIHTNGKFWDEKLSSYFTRDFYIDLTGPQCDVHEYDSNGFPLYMRTASICGIDCPLFIPRDMHLTLVLNRPGMKLKTLVTYFGSHMDQFFKIMVDANEPGTQKIMEKVIEKTICTVAEKKVNYRFQSK